MDMSLLPSLWKEVHEFFESKNKQTKPQFPFHVFIQLQYTRLATFAFILTFIQTVLAASEVRFPTTYYSLLQFYASRSYILYAWLRGASTLSKRHSVTNHTRSSFITVWAYTNQILRQVLANDSHNTTPLSWHANFSTVLMRVHLPFWEACSIFACYVTASMIAFTSSFVTCCNVNVLSG